MDDKERAQPTQDAGDPFPPRRRPLRPAVLIGSIVLVALLIAAIFTANRFLGANSNAIPTPTLTPGTNLFYVQITPSWGTILIDGQQLAHLPDPSSDPPLQLSAGIHEVVWQASPFASQRCTIVVPPSSAK